MLSVFSESEVSSWKNDSIEKEFEFVQKAAKLIRSARSDYNIPNKNKIEAYIVSTDKYQTETLRKFANDLSTIAFCSKIELDIAPPSTGCAILTLSGQCEIYLMLKGLIETEKELAKLQKKKEQLEQTVVKLNQAISATDYETKVPAEVQQSNLEKLNQSQSEIIRITAAMDTLKLM